MLFQRGSNSTPAITDVLFPLAEWYKTHVGETDQNLIVPANTARLHTAAKSLDFLEHNEMKKNLNHRAHLIWQCLISLSSSK
jgi:hypothetical protein